MFSTTATLGRKVCIVSSWKLETSSTAMVSGVAPSTSEIAGGPILPPTIVGYPPAPIISPASVVVVVLPLDPVIATMVPGKNWAANSISPITVSPSARACLNGNAGVQQDGNAFA